MDGFINSSIEKQTIYEIYRACRLCGAGAGYKMPIMQNVVHLDGAEVELRQKIRECVQVEVHQEDKMPPLICELCVDKVNDFYEFLEMCRQTNKRTRLRLGLPAQTMSRGTSDAGDCILGVTEPVYLNEDSNDSLLKPRGKNKGRVTEESKNTKKTKSKQNEVRNLRSKHVSPLPQRAAKRSREEDMSLSMLKKTSTRQSTASPKSILRKEKEVKAEEEWSPTRSKRSRDSRNSKPDTVKKVKIVEKPVPSKPSSKSDLKCKTCKAQFNTNKALNNHARTHNKPQSRYRSTSKQEKKNNCSTCKKDFPTKLSLDRHKCAKNNTNKCGNCGKYIPNARNLTKHEGSCRPKKELKISPKLLKQLRPLQIRVKRCDPLLKSVGQRYDVAGVDCHYGLDKNCIYPYLRTLRIKTEPSYMVNIHDTIDDFDLNQDYVHWDSESSESDSEMSDLREKSVGTLANLSLKTIFSHRFLGKVPKRKRRVKPDKAYDSLLNFGSDVRLGIDNIISSLDNDKTVNDAKDNDNDSLFGEDKTPAVSNDDFDSLFNINNDSEINDKRKSDEGKCEISDKNNDKDTEKSENKINNDSTTELDTNDNDTIKNTQENDKCESSEVVSDNVSISEVNKDKTLSSAEDSTTKESEHTEDNGEVSKNNDNNDKVGTNKDDDSNSSINNEKTVQIENNDTVFDNKTETAKSNDKGESNIVNNRDVSIDKDRDVSIDNDRDVSIDKDKDKGVHVNGDDKIDFDDLEDISDSEMDDSRLMDAINEQIGEKETGDKSQDNDRDSISVVKSTDLESISSEELLN